MVAPMLRLRHMPDAELVVAMHGAVEMGAAGVAVHMARVLGLSARSREQQGGPEADRCEELHVKISL